MVTIEELPCFSDSRGSVFEPLTPNTIPLQRNVHVALTEPGCIRGNHYHKRGTEVLVAMGPVLVRLRENGALRDVSVPEGKTFRFTIPPGVSHAIQNTGTRQAAIVAFNTLEHDPGMSDLVRDVIMELPSPR